MSNLLVSIIVPCFEQAQYLDEALLSVLDQTYTHWECIIVNDGSSDNTEEIAKRWVEKDGRFLLINKNNEGVCIARNTAIEKAKGVYILPLDADVQSKWFMVRQFFLENKKESCRQDMSM
jgi:glycosyltransferase involved in cell wall biosynthesis